jgi:hypothetical protein
MHKFAAAETAVVGLLLLVLATDASDALRLLKEWNPAWPFIIGIALLLTSIVILWIRPSADNSGDDRSDLHRRFP